MNKIIIDGEEWTVSSNEKIGDKDVLLIYCIIIPPKEPEKSPLEEWLDGIPTAFNWGCWENLDIAKQAARNTANWLVDELEKFWHADRLYKKGYSENFCIAGHEVLAEAKRLIGRK